jgi:hypothetical protein
MDMRTGSVDKWAGEGNSPLLKSKRSRKTGEDGLGSIPISREETRRKDARERDRLPGRGQRCRVTYRGGDVEVEIVNLSGGGAMIAATIVPNLGERLHLHLGADGTVESVVRWVKSGRIGLEFAHETHLDCADEERAELLLDAIDRAFPHRRTGGPAAKPVTDDDSDQRIATRHPLIWSAEVQTRSGNFRVRIRNISATGALIQCTKPLPLGREVILDLGKGGTVDATVSWAVGDHAGLSFDEQFDMKRLSHSKPTVAPARWLRPAYLKNDVGADSAWDDAWSRMSVDELRSELEGFLKR